MKNKYSKILVSVITVIMILSISCIAFAGISDDQLTTVKYSKEFETWLNLPEEERAKTIMPLRMLETEDEDNNNIEETNNIFKLTKFLKASFASNYDLREVIPENMVVRNQGQTSLCWAFSTLANLESTLAMKDKADNKTAVGYDFSERHLAYATTRAAFLNDVINQKGLNKNVTDSGNYVIGSAYLVNGSGAVSESLMPFSGEFTNVDLQTVNGKTQETTVTDFDLYMPTITTEAQRQEAIEVIKSHIMNKGGASAMIYGASLNNECYNNNTAALYTNDSTTYPVNHGVVIVGWDDNFDKNNFKEGMRPTSNGAWIIKNSWGTGVYGYITNVKEALYGSDETLQSTYASAEEVPDEVIVNHFKNIYGTSKVKLENGIISIEFGDNGFIYVSYEDSNILSGIFMIDKVSYGKENDNIYQYEYSGPNNAIFGQLSSTGLSISNKIYMASVFDTKSSNEELTSVGITTLTPLSQCKVYVNSASSDKTFANLQAVELKEGEYENLESGYHTIEFANPIKLTGTSFAVVIEFIADTNGRYRIPAVENIPNSAWSEFTPVAGKTFIGYRSDIVGNTMVDTSTILGGYNIPIKAFTNNIVEETLTLQSITITTPPTTREYTVGDNFDKTGMVVKANYTNGTSKTLASTDYTVTNGTSLKANQNTVTISYTEGGVTKTTTQRITVNASTTPVTPEDPTEPTLSNMKNSTATITKAESYTYTNIDKTEYTLVKIKLSNIVIGDDVSTRKFYFYLSNSKGETNILSSKWTEFTVNTSNGSATIDIDTRDLPYVNDLDDGDNLYLYVKEVATLNDSTTQTISTIEVGNDTKLLLYVDDVLKVDKEVKTGDTIGTDTTVSTEVGKDTTVATKSIPQTGARVLIISFVVIGIVTVGGVSFLRYKNIMK